MKGFFLALLGALAASYSDPAIFSAPPDSGGREAIRADTTSPDPVRLRRTGILALDSLPQDDWLVATPPLSYGMAAGWATALPGGGQIYSGHRVRAGFLFGLEGFLLLDGLVYRRQFFEAKDREAGIYFDSAASLYRQWSENPANEEKHQAFLDEMGKARRMLDLKKKHEDLRRSELVWAGGLHFYGLMDALEMVRKSRHPSPGSLSGSRAFLLGLVLPGAGQLYTGHYGKAGMLYMGLGGSLAASIFRQEMVVYFRGRLRTARQEGAEADELESLQQDLTQYRKRRNQYYWGMGLLYLYSIGDAVVDAALSDFDSPSRFALVPGLGPEPSLTVSWRF